MRGLIIALLALVLVAGDSSFHLPQLLNNASHAKKPEPLLWQASLLGSERARQQLVSLAAADKNAFWLEKLVSLRQPEAAWALYQLDKDATNSERLLRLAARGGVADAQLAYAMTSDDMAVRENWLIRAAEQHHAPAQAALADLYLLNQSVDKARPWLEKTADAYPQSAFQLGRMLFEEGDMKGGMKLLQRAAINHHAMAKRLLEIIQDYQVQTPQAVTFTPWTQKQQCAQKIQMFATSLSSIERASQLYEAFVTDERLQSLPVCLQKPIWLSQDSVRCASDWKQTGRMGCDIRQLEKPVESTRATHIIMIGDAGKANVHNGIMYLDLSDSYSVLVHELAHFAGFVDEYPLPLDTAQQYCDGAKAPNLIVDGKITYKPLASLDQWQALNKTVAIGASKSCSSVAVNAYKPSRQITFMEHHDSGVIPDIYLELWKKQLLSPEAQRPVFMNFFQHFHYAGDQQRAGKWLDRYNAFNAQATRPAE